MKQSRIKYPCVSLECIIRIYFFWRKKQIYTRHGSKQTTKLPQLQNKKFEFTHNYFPRRLLNEQR